MATMLPRTLLALCLLLCACKRETMPNTGIDKILKCANLKAQAAVHGSKSEYPEELASLQQALALTDKVAAPQEWSDVAKAVAGLHDRLGKHDEAETLYREILDQNDKQFGKDSLESAQTLESLAHLVQTRGDAEESESLMRRAVAVREAILGKISPEEIRMGLHGLALSSSQWRLGVFLEKSERLDEAESMMARAVKAAVDSSKNIQYSQWTFDLLVKAYRKLLLKMGDTEQQAQGKIDKMMEPLTKK